jgi:hypothetical protein
LLYYQSRMLKRLSRSLPCIATGVLFCPGFLTRMHPIKTPFVRRPEG